MLYIRPDIFWQWPPGNKTPPVTSNFLSGGPLVHFTLPRTLPVRLYCRGQVNRINRRPLVFARASLLSHEPGRGRLYSRIQKPFLAWSLQVTFTFLPLMPILIIIFQGWSQASRVHCERSVTGERSKGRRGESLSHGGDEGRLSVWRVSWYGLCDRTGLKLSCQWAQIIWVYSDIWVFGKNAQIILRL